MKRMVIEVLGVPDVDRQDRIVDQLKIHFLSRSNSGADVLQVLYPTTSPGKAYVIFESEEVPGVLQHTHVLEVDSRFYPVHVQRAHRAEVDMTVETTLDIQKFPKPLEVQQLLKKHGFEVTEHSTSYLHLKGSFLGLKLLRKQLTQLLAQNTQLQSRTPSDLSNSVSQYSSNQGHVIGNGMYPQSQRPLIASGYSPAKYQRPISPTYGDSASGGSPRSFPSLYDDYYQGRHLSSHPRKTSLLVDKEVLDYAQIYNQDFKNIESLYNTEMTFKDDGEIKMVTFLGKNCEKAQAKLQTIIQDITPNLRTQEIHLNEYSKEQQIQILKRSQLQENLGVMIKREGDILKLVGSSGRSYLIKQMLLGRSDEPSPSQRGRDLERNTRLRRSSSLTRPCTVSKHEETIQGHHPEPEYYSSVVKNYSPSHDQDMSQSRRGRPGSPSELPARRRSNSEVRTKTRKAQEEPRLPDHVLPPSTGEEMKSVRKKVPTFKQAPWMDFNKVGSAFKLKIRQNK